MLQEILLKRVGMSITFLFFFLRKQEVNDMVKHTAYDILKEDKINLNYQKMMQVIIKTMRTSDMVKSVCSTRDLG